MIPRRTRQAAVLLAVLAASSWWLTRNRVDTAGQPFDNLDTRLDYALWDFSARLLDEQGQVQLQIDAPMLRNNAGTQIGTVENPRIRIHQDGDEWTITADSAIITADRDFVSLAGSVNMLRLGDSPRGVMEIQTRDVMLNISPQTAVTESLVSIRENGDTLEAVGMRLNMKTDRYELLDQVRARYATP